MVELQIRRADGSFLKLRRVCSLNTEGIMFRVDDAESSPLEVYVSAAELEHVATFIDVTLQDTNVLDGGDS